MRQLLHITNSIADMLSTMLLCIKPIVAMRLMLDINRQLLLAIINKLLLRITVATIVTV